MRADPKSIDPNERALAALESVECAQHELDRAVQALSGIVGMSDHYDRTRTLRERTRAYWHSLDKARKRRITKLRLDEMATAAIASTPHQCNFNGPGLTCSICAVIA